MNGVYANMIFPAGTGVIGSQQDPYTMGLVAPMPTVGTMQVPMHQTVQLQPQGAPAAGDQPYFENNRLYVPRAGWLQAGPPRSVAGSRSVAPRQRDVQMPGKSQEDQVKELQKKLLPQLQKALAVHEQEKEEKEAVLESKWFGLPDNTYGAGIWAVLVLEVEATEFLLLFSGRNSENVPKNQRWKWMDARWGGFFGGDAVKRRKHKKRKDFLAVAYWCCVDIYQWIAKRLAPFLRSIFFQLSTVLLSIISWLLQFGFTYALDEKIGGATFFDDPNSRNICATSGWVQLISVGFFLAFMSVSSPSSSCSSMCCLVLTCGCAVIRLGQIPKILRNILLIWTSTKETDESRGEDNANDLWIDEEDPKDVRRILKEGKMYTPSMEGMLPEGRKNFIHRTKTSHVVRRLVSTLFPLAEASIIGYLMYVGVKYIFWSGWVSLDRATAAYFPSFPLEDEEGFFPWMTNTAGVEEIIMFIVDIDEAIFTLVLPKSIQKAVSDTQLNCAGWLPTSFRRSDFISIGKHEYVQPKKTRSAGDSDASGDRSTENSQSGDSEDEDDEDDYGDQWMCGFARLKVLRRINTKYLAAKRNVNDATRKIAELEKKISNTPKGGHEPVSYGCCSRPRFDPMAQLQRNPYGTGEQEEEDYEKKLEEAEEKRQKEQSKLDRYSRIFDSGIFWRLYCKAMEDTLKFAEFLESMTLKEADAHVDDESVKSEKADLWYSIYQNFDQYCLWNTADSTFWTAHYRAEQERDPTFNLELERFLLEVSLTVGNMLLRVTAPNLKPINAQQSVAGSYAGSRVQRDEDQRSEGYGSDTEDDDSDEWMGGLWETMQNGASTDQVQKLDRMKKGIDDHKKAIRRCNIALQETMDDKEPDMVKFFQNLKSECSGFVNLSEEFVAKPVRHQWMNLLPDATFLLTFVLITLPALVVVVTRARCGCKDFRAVEVDELEGLTLKSSKDVAEDAAVMAPLVIVCVIAFVFTLLLGRHTLQIWSRDDEARKFIEQRIVTGQTIRTKKDDAPAAPQMAQ